MRLWLRMRLSVRRPVQLRRQLRLTPARVRTRCPGPPRPGHRRSPARAPGTGRRHRTERRPRGSGKLGGPTLPECGVNRPV